MQGVVLCSRLEGIIPAIESAHAIAALNYMQLKLEDIVVLNLSGRGDKDLSTIINYLDLQDAK
jgi:tryptophan synthase beta chain